MNYVKVKRFLALLKAQALDPTKEIISDDNLPKGFKESFENQDEFRGWRNYHETWDVTKKDPWTIYIRSRSNVADWEHELHKVIPVITPNGIVSAEEYEKAKVNGVSIRETKTIAIEKELIEEE